MIKKLYHTEQDGALMFLGRATSPPGNVLIPWADMKLTEAELQDILSATLPPDNPLSTPDGHPQGLIQSYVKVTTESGTAIIRGEKPESTYRGLKDPS